MFNKLFSKRKKMNQKLYVMRRFIIINKIRFLKLDIIQRFIIAFNKNFLKA